MSHFSFILSRMQNNNVCQMGCNHDLFKWIFVPICAEANLKFHVCSTVSLTKQIYIERDIFTKKTNNINMYPFITKLVLLTKCCQHNACYM